MIKTNVYTATDNLEEGAPVAPHSGLVYASGNLSWTKADGRQSLVVYSRTAIDSFRPFDGVSYPVGIHTCFSVLYRGLGSSTPLTPEQIGTGLYVYLFAFNGVASTEKYNRASVSLFILPVSADNTLLTEDGFSFGLEDGSGNILVEN